jgi:hypothetical protein
MDGDQVLLNQIKVTRVMNAVAAGTTAQNGSSVDMTGFDGVLFVALFGALTATQVTSLKAQQSADDGSADDFSDLTGTLTGPMGDDDDNKGAALDVFRPEKRYVRPVIGRGTANAVIDGVIAIQYCGRSIPTSQAASIAFAEAHVSPAEGNA